MMTNPTAFRTEVLLSFQRALWDLVTPTLRAVAARPVYPLIEARFIYEAVGDEEREIASDAEAFVVADFLSPVTVQFTAVGLAPTEKRYLEPGEIWIFRRRESDWL